MTALEVDGDAGATGPGPLPPRRRRWLRWVAVGVAVVVALAVVGVVYLSTRRPASHPTSHGAAPSNHTAPAPSRTWNANYAVNCLAVGATVNVGGRTTDGPKLGLFHTADAAIGPLTIRRSFEPSLPTSFATSSAAADPAQGLHSFVSWKAPNGDYRGVIAGTYDQQITAWAKSVPRTGVFATAYHEPENNMSAADFVALQRHLYPLIKKANPTIRWGPVYMSYWWDPSQTAHYVGDPQAWFPGKGYADFVGLDWYGADPTPMTTSRSFQNWYKVFAPTGLPLVMPEYGQYFAPVDRAPDPAKLQARVSAIRQDAAWIAQHPQFKAWLYWQGGGNTGQWRLTDAASQQAWQSIAASGCRA